MTVMTTASPSRYSTRRWTLAGASLIVMAGVLEPTSGVAQTTNIITGTTVTAIQTITSGNSLSITSTGVIAPTSGPGISIPGSTTIGSIWNDGRVASVNSNGISPGVGASIVGIYNTGAISAASNVLQAASNSRIGTITNSGTLVGATGLNLDNSTLGSITNSGLITATGSNGPVSMSGTTSAAALINTSTGTLVGSQGSAAALQVFGTATSLTLLDNAGLMRAATGIKLNGTIGALNNSGTIQGTSASGFAVSISSTGRIGAFNNTGAIQGNIADLRTGGLTITGGAGGVYGSLTGATPGAVGTITAAGNVTFAGNTALNADVTSASGTGTITNTGVLHVQRSTTITGAYSQPANATLQIGVVSTSVYGQLNVSSGVTLTSGASIVLMAAPSGTLAAGSYTIFSGPTGTDYSGVTVTAPSSGFEVATSNTVVSSTNNLVVTLTAPVVEPPVDPPVDPPVEPPVVGPIAGVIDTSKAYFSNDDSALQAPTVTFDGGTLQPNAPLTLPQTVIIGSSNGAIDPNGAVVTLSGSVTGPGQLTVTGSGSLVVSNSVSNTGGLNVQSGGLTVANGGAVSAPVMVGSGTVTVEQGGRVSGPVTVGKGVVTINQGGFVVSSMTVGSGGTAKVDGEVNGPVNVADGATLGGSGRIGGDTSISGVLAPGASPGTLVFTGPVTLNASSTYQVEIDGPGTGTGAGAHDQVIVAGSSFAAGGRLAPILRGISGAATNSYTPVLGQTFQVVSASGGVTGRFASLAQPAAGLAAGTRFDVIYAPTSITVAVTPASYANLAAAGLAQSDNQRAVGAALESFRPAAGAQGSALFDTLYPLSAARIGPALDQLSGQIHADMLQADHANRLRFGRAIAARQAGITTSAGGAVDLSIGARTDVATGSGSSQAANGAWGQLLGGWSDGDGAEGVTGGAVLGADRALSDDLKLGMAIGFLRTDVKADAGLGKGQVDSYQAAAYASWTPGAVFVDAALGYGVSRYETSRTIAFLDESAQSEADGQDLSAEVTVGTRVLHRGAWMEPHAGLRWDRIERDGFTESGAALAALRQAGVDHDAVRGSIGARFGATWTYGGVTLEPTALVAWAHDFQDPAAATAVLGGARFSVLPEGAGRDAAILGAGLGARMSDRLTAQVGYTGEIRSDSADHGFSAGLRWSW